MAGQQAPLPDLTRQPSSWKMSRTEQCARTWAPPPSETINGRREEHMESHRVISVSTQP